MRDSIFEFPGTKPGLTDERRTEIRAEYQKLLDRAKRITTHPSGFVSSIEFNSREDADRASELRAEMFIQHTLGPRDILA